MADENGSDDSLGTTYGAFEKIRCFFIVPCCT